MKVKISLVTKEKNMKEVFRRLFDHVEFIMESREGIELFGDTDIEFTIEIKTKE